MSAYLGQRPVCIIAAFLLRQLLHLQVHRGLLRLQIALLLFYCLQLLSQCRQIFLQAIDSGCKRCEHSLQIAVLRRQCTQLQITHA